MPDMKIIIILVLLLLSYIQYSYPETGNKLVSFAWDPVQKTVGSTFSSATSSLTTKCTNTVAPVCGSNGVTYNNACLAGQAGITNVTSGAC